MWWMAAKTFVKGLNWQTLMLKFGICLVLLGSAYGLGRYHEKLNVAENKAEVAQATVKEIQLFVPVISRQIEKTAKQEQRLQHNQEVYTDEVDKRRRPADCDLSSDELSAFQKLGEG